MRPAGLESRPRKRFGQHFLHDPAVIERIAAAIAPQSGEAVVEIGPGRGALTRRLLASDCGWLDAIEIDRDLAARLREEMGGDSRFHLHNEDALQVDFGALARRRGRRLRVVGNLPYNISTPLLFHLLQSVSDIHDLHVMLQREVIARMAAQPGDRAMEALTVSAPWVQVERLFDVGPGAFRPPPQVWSAVARLVVRTGPAFPLCPAFPAVVAAAFSHRRKTLRNALRGLATGEQIEACGVDPSARPETISPALFNAIAGKVKLPSG